MGDSEGFAECCGSIGGKSGKSGIKGSSNESETDWSGGSEMFQHLQKDPAVLSPADADENPVAVIDHVVIDDSGSRKAADFLECRAHGF